MVMVDQIRRYYRGRNGVVSRAAGSKTYRRTRVLTAIAVIAVSLTASVVAPISPVAAGPVSPYPTPLPDFAHPGSPHGSTGGDRPPLSVETGYSLGPRPLLVIFGTYSDSDFDNPAASTILPRIFGPLTYGTVASYFFTASAGNLLFQPARETFDTANDGLVTMDLGTFATFEGKTETERTAQVLNAVNQFVDFESYDTNDDDKVTGTELGVLFIKSATDATNNCGVNWAVSGVSADGKGLRFYLPTVTTATNSITFAHELAHQTLGLEDLYLEGIEATALGGTTCSSSEAWRFPNAYERIHWGWDSQPEPIVVDSDGFYQFAAGAELKGPTIRVLYDPSRGTDEYFALEYRNKTPGLYDEHVSDNGLYVWRVKDSSWPPEAGSTSPVNVLVRPDPSKPETTADAWDPSDLATPQRTMTSAWADGTPSNLAVRAIGPSTTDFGGLRVYLDVRGPGILVDPADSLGAPKQVTIPLGVPTAVTFPVMNTGEETDTFEFSVTDGDLINTVESVQQLTLAPGQQATVSIDVTVPLDHPLGLRPARVVGRSLTNNSVLSRARFTADVVKRNASLEYTGVSSVQYSDQTALSAVLTDDPTGAPMEGQTVTFVVAGQTVTATTDVLGVARATYDMDQPSQSTVVRVLFNGDATHTNASTVSAFRVNKEDLTWAYNGATTLGVGGSANLAAQATQEADNAPGDLSLAGATFTLTPTLTSTPVSTTAVVSTSGSSTTSLADLVADLWSVTVSVSADNPYWNSPTSVPVDLAVFNPAASARGAAKGTDSVGGATSLALTAAYDGNGPKGSVSFRSSAGRFQSSEIRWIIVVGSTALIEAKGFIGNSPRTLRVRIFDGGIPGRGADWYTSALRDGAGTVRYSSGQVAAVQANLTVSTG